MLTQQELKVICTYSPTTGLFTRNYNTSSYKQGEVIGANKDKQNYISMTISGSRYQAHNLAWLYVFGEFPKHHLDHINHSKHDNRICNLREATFSENGYNSRKAKDNITGTKGIVFVRSRIPGVNDIVACKGAIIVKGTRTTKHFGIVKYGTLEKALQAATIWITKIRAQLHGEFAHHGELS